MVAEALAARCGQTSPRRVQGSPVVPGSARKIFEDPEAALYTVTILKGQYESGRFEASQHATRAREGRYARMLLALGLELAVAC
jgi:hypothetical protein